MKKTLVLASSLVALSASYAAPTPPDKTPNPEPSVQPTERPRTGETTKGPKNDTGVKGPPEIPDPGKGVFDKFQNESQKSLQKYSNKGESKPLDPSLGGQKKEPKKPSRPKRKLGQPIPEVQLNFAGKKAGDSIVGGPHNPGQLDKVIKGTDKNEGREPKPGPSATPGDKPTK